MTDSTGKKSTFKIVAIVIVVLIVAIIALPFLLDVNHFRPEIESRLSGALGRSVELGHMRLSIFSGSLAVDNIRIMDNPAFSKDPFVTAGSLAIGVEMRPLIFSQKINITEIALDQPSIYLRSQGGKWNFSDLGAAKSPTASESAPKDSSVPQDVLIAKVAITDGRVEISEAPAKPKLYEDVDFTVSNLSLRSTYPFTLTAVLPGRGTLDLRGTFGPLHQADIMRTPLEAQLQLNRFDLVASGFAPADGTLAGLCDFKGNLTSDGSTARSKGAASIGNLHLVKDAAVAPQPVSLAYDLAYDLKKQTGTLTDARVGYGAAALQLAGNFDLGGAVTRVQMKLQGDAVPVDDLQTLLPTFGIVLPKGAALAGGTLNTEITAEGPLDNLAMNGGASINETRLTGFDLGEKLALIAKLAGLPTNPDTLIERMGTDMRWTPQGIEISNLQLIMPLLGQLTGAGTITPDQNLDFTMKAILKSSNEKIAALTKGRELDLNFFVRGSASNPQFVPDYKNAARSLLDTALSHFGSLKTGDAAAPDAGSKQNNNDKGKAIGDALKGLFNRN